jgi:hypothetical protein
MNKKTSVLFLLTLAMLPVAVLAQPTTKNKHVDTFGGGAATVLVIGNKFDGPNHVEDWYNGLHYNCFRKASLSDKEVKQKLTHGWTEVPWGDPYVSDHGLITLRGPYICKINTITG